MLKLILILCLIILIMIFIFKINFNTCENFNVAFQHLLDGEIQELTTQDINDLDASTTFSCTEFGCVKDSSGTFLFDECKQKCRWKYNGKNCVKDENGVGEYLNKSSCKLRYICDQDKGKCILAPANKSDSFDTLNDCREQCWFKKNGGYCHKFNPKEDTSVPSFNKYQYREDCENRYNCVDGKCVKTPNGVFAFERQCLQDCNENIYNRTNHNKIHLYFDKKLDNMYEYNRDIFLKKLNNFIYDLKDSSNNRIITQNELLGILLKEKVATLVFSNYLKDNKKLNKIFVKIEKLLFTIIVNYEDYNLVRCLNESCSIDKDCKFNSVFTRNVKDDSIDKNKYLIIEIEGLDRGIKQKSLQYDNLYSIDSSASKNDKLVYIDNLEKSVKIVNSDFYADEMNKLFYSNESTNLYENNTNFDVKIQDIDDYIISLLESKLYYDVNLIKFITSNYNNVKLLTLSRKNNTDFASINEILILFYRNNNFINNYIQVPIDLKKKQKLFFLEQKYRINNDKIYNVLNANDYKIINNITMPETNEFENILNNLVTTTKLKLKFKFTYFEKGLINEEINYIEETDLVDNKYDCKFSPKGETIFECLTHCENEDKNCSVEKCKELCNNCKNLNCKWNISDFNALDQYKPDPPKIKCFSGNGAIKVTWIRPFSRYLPDKYYIIVINKSLNTLDIHQHYSEQEMNEYIISGLQNSSLYDIKVVSKNKYGASEESNLETIIPNKKNNLNILTEVKLSDYEDSIESFYKNTNDYDPVIKGVNVNNRISALEREMVLRDLQKILNDKNNLNSENNNYYNVNIY